jgi:hypothetical protein
VAQPTYNLDPKDGFVPTGRYHYTTKDSGQRAEYASGMVRDTQEGKARFDLIMADGVPYDAQFLTRIAALMTRGIGKYGERNWEKADSLEELQRFRGSALRHLMQWYCGDSDEDHASAAVVNILFHEMTEFKMRRQLTAAALLGEAESD